MKKCKVILSILCALMILITSAITSGASGSKDYNKDDNSYRFYTEWSNLETAGVARKQAIYAYVFAGETIYYGSSVYNSKLAVDGKTAEAAATGYDVVVINPEDKIVNNIGDTPAEQAESKKMGDVLENGIGHISSVAMERAGPNINGSNPNGYTPLSFTATKSGIYEFHFHSYDAAADSANKNPIPALTQNKENQRGSTAAFWDITIADKNKTIKTGRTYANYLALNTGNNFDIRTPVKASSTVFVLTDDSYIYKVDLKGINPYGFILFANSRGLCTVGGDSTPIYHSVASTRDTMADLQSTYKVDYKSPNSPNTPLNKSYKIFFEKPSDELKNILYTEPETPTKVENLVFHGTVSSQTTYQGQGGNFTFDIEKGSSVTIELDFSNGADPKNKANTVTLVNSVTPGKNTFYWNGNFDNGEQVPIGVYDIAKIKIVSSSKSGEIHFPLLDVEANDDMTITRINGPDTNDRSILYYNNRPLKEGKIQSNDPIVQSGTRFKLSDGTYTETRVSGFDVNVDASMGIDSSVDSNTLSFSYVKGQTNTGGNATAMDVWTYYKGPEVEQSSPETEIVVIPPVENIGKINGVIYYDAEQAGTNYSSSNGDYGLADITVNLLNDKGEIVGTTTTDEAGNYHFYNIVYGNYKITTSVNTAVFTQTTKNTSITLNGTTASKDVGYYFDATASKDINVQKKWANNIATERNITVKLFGKYIDNSGMDQIVDMKSSIKLAAGNGWRGEFNALPNVIDNCAATYFIKEYYTYEGKDVLIGTSQVVGDKSNGKVNNATETSATNYSATFEWSNLSATEFLMTITNTPPTDYKITFHTNITGLPDKFKVYAPSATSVFAPEANGNYLTAGKTIEEFTEIPILPDDNSAYSNNKYIFSGWYYGDGTPIKWDKDKFISYTDIYARWTNIGTVNKDAADLKVTGSSKYSGFDLFGLQIRPDIYDTVKPGLRFVTSYSEKLIGQLEGLFTTPYTSNAKTYNDQKLKYGYATAKTDTINKFIAANSLDKNTFKLTLDCPYVKDANCTKTNIGTDVDHRNYKTYRLSSMIIMYDNAGKDEATVKKAKETPVMARAYLRYTDANGLFRTAYNDYTGTRLYGGCSTSYKFVSDMVNNVNDVV